MSRFIAIIAVVAVMFGMVITGGEPVHAFAPIIVDNDDSIGPFIGSDRVETTGTWNKRDGSHIGGVPCEGTDYFEASTTDAINTLTWIPDLPVAGFYEVEACWIDGLRGWRTKNAKYEITYVNEQGGVDLATVVRNQYYRPTTPPVDGYVSLGTFYFNAGTGGSVKITDDGADTKIVIADSVRFTLLDAASIPTDIIVDTEEAALTGAWKTRTKGWLWGTYYGDSYLQASTTDGITDEAVWTPYLPVTGLYNIYGYWPSGSVTWWRADTATYFISDMSSDIPYTVDIQSQSQTWVPIGSGEFVEGQGGSVTITETDGDNSGVSKDSVIVADAVQFELDCAVVVAPEKGYAPTVNIGTASTIDYTVDTPYTATLVGKGCAGQSPAWSWSSSDVDGSAIVNSNGLVSGVSEGRAVITAMATVNGNQIAGAHEVAVTRRLVDKAWLDQNNVKIILAHGGTTKPNNIPGAIKFNIKNLAPKGETSCTDPTTSGIAWALKDEAGLKAVLGNGGISSDDNLVIYDDSTAVFGRGDLATYLLWVLDMVGHDIKKLHLLNGQFKQWKADGGVAGAAGTPTPTIYDPDSMQIFNDSVYTTSCFIYQHLNEGAQANSDYVWLATIPQAEFDGHHIPCAIPINFGKNLINWNATGDFRFKSPDQLLAIYITNNSVTRDKYISVY
ncbi:MAG: hypothetical protein ACC630_00875 [Nitrospinota bacterium]